MYMGKKITLVSAMSSGQVIGFNNDLPWTHLKADMKHFVELTKGNIVIMGNTTFKSLKAPLPNRTNIVLTQQQHRPPENGVIYMSSVEEIFNRLQFEYDEVMVIGGGQIYSKFLPYADALEITEIKLDLIGDTVFPEFKDRFKEESRITTIDEPTGTEMDFVRYVPI